MPIDKLSNTTRNYLRICSNHLRAAVREYADESLESLLACKGWFDIEINAICEFVDWHQYRNLIDRIEGDRIIPGIGMIIDGSTQYSGLGVLRCATESSRTVWVGL